MADPDRTQEQAAARPTRAPRADAADNVRRIKAAAKELLPGDPEAGIAQIAALAKVSRATVYRTSPHAAASSSWCAQRSRPARTPTSRMRCAPRASCSAASVPLSIPDVLNKVPPHLLAEQIVTESRRLVGASAVAVMLRAIPACRPQLSSRCSASVSRPRRFPDRRSPPPVPTTETFGRRMCAVGRPTHNGVPGISALSVER